jgi:N-acetylglucosaminyl-diphospho-decaprenol L-rhamnosyltransferase
LAASSPSSPAEAGARLAAVVVDFNAGTVLARCVASLQEAGVEEIVVVENGATGSTAATLNASANANANANGNGNAGNASASGNGNANANGNAHGRTRPVKVVRPGANLGYGAGANFGARTTSAHYLLVSNPDVLVSPGAVATLAGVLDTELDIAVVGPMLREQSGAVYPSGRDFPDLAEALGHAFIGLFWGGNPWTRRYRRIGPEQHRPRDADWVSGACFLVRRDAWDSVGGFDESFFMYVEDVDLCWRLGRAGWRVRYEPAAEVVHEQGHSTSRHPYRMLASHHRSMWRFAVRSSAGNQRAFLPLIAVGLGVRLVLAWLEHLVGARSRRRPAHG